MRKKKPLVLNEQDHKVFLTDTSMNDIIANPEDILMTTFQTSYVDGELAYIYYMMTTCVAEARRLGQPEIAKELLVEMTLRAMFVKSIGGFERTWLVIVETLQCWNI